MLKSVFSRIMAAFTVVLLLCFVAVLTVVTSGLFLESREKKTAELSAAAEEVALYMNSVQRATFSSMESILKSEAFGENLKSVASYSGAKITVARSDGTVAVTSDAGGEANPPIPSETVAAVAESLLEDPTRYAVSNLDGYLSVRSLNSFARVDGKNGELMYLIVATGGLSDASSFAVTMAQRTAVVSIWVLFAAIICVYFVSKRITRPIRQIGEAARDFAGGNFNSRVDVQGPDEVEELGKAFNSMADTIARHEESRNTFLSNVSHDLRTPMTAISGFADGMLDGTIPPDQRDRYLRIISDESHRLSRMVNTLLEVSRLESGRNLNVQDFNLTEKARQVIISLGGKIEAKNLEIDFDGGDEDAFVSADPDAIHQVLYNLLDNAVKFTDPNGTVGIRISSGTGTGKTKKALVRIRNTGKGIPEEEMNRIFERFYKSDRSRGLDKTGTGLGLYIVKTILEKHGETIRAESVPGVYTEFRFTLSPSGKKTRENERPAYREGGVRSRDGGRPEGNETEIDNENGKGYLT
ncbi:MAG: HAMP domain-containing histidine kinase [Clostridia bacterium]|nr:HAMP domain-containing histidine kinase [Clostridia bacterium]